MTRLRPMTGKEPSRQINIGHDHSAVYAVQDGDLHVHQRIGTHLIDELSFGPVPADSGEQPSRLLTAGNRVVSFTGREHEIAELRAWRDDPTAVAVRLLHGGAGQGKTRLAHRFAELCRTDGWITLRARHSRDVAAVPVEVSAGRALVKSGRLLVVVDYAERWPLSDLLALLLDRRLHGTAALRVLLLARPVGNWWHALTYRLGQSLGAHTDSAELAPLGATPAGSRAAFDVARADFARVLGVTDPGSPAPEVEGSVLTIHMAALAFVLAAKHGDTPPTDPGHLSAYLLNRERSHWQAMYDNRRVESTPEVMGRAVHVAALTRPLDHASALLALQSTGIADGARVLDDHEKCYPAHDPATRLEPLYPDRLAEDFVALQTPGHAVAGFRADSWAVTALNALTSEDSPNLSTALPLLVEAARRWPHLAELHLVPLLRKRPELALLAGAAALSAVASAPMIPLDVLAAIEAALPNEPPQDLYAGIAAVTERLARDTTDPVRAARLLQKLGWRLLDSGRVADGLAALDRAVATARRPPAPVAPLESALRTAGRAHARARDWANAAAMLSEAVSLWDGGEPAVEDVATCLGDLSLALWHTGRHASSLSVRHRALQRLRRLVAGDSRHRLTLVRTLVQQAEQLREGERRSDALDALDEAGDLLRAIAGDTGLERDFAAALTGRAKTLQSLGRLAEAESAASAAVRFLRQLAGLNVSFDQNLAQALATHGEILGALGRWPGAIDAQETATAIVRRLGRINQERHRLDLVHQLIRFARACRDAGQRAEDGLTALTEALGLMRPGDPVPAAVTHGLAADLLDAAGRHDDAAELRRSRPAGHQQPPSPRPQLRVTADDRRRARSVPSMAYNARWKLQELPSRDVAGTLIAMSADRGWLDAVIRGFRPARQREILRWLASFEDLADNDQVLQLTSKMLLAAPPDFVADVLMKADPASAAAIVNFEQWHRKSAYLLPFLQMEDGKRILRLLGYEPYT
ncbi:ATP-binding protein [Actinoplanes sp. NPDC051861]|uniref:ATP-binding protein n=1 Tax=Actinoplanes sp. NPDC051861 TaxID=3155170 RepID=UPI00343B3396